MNDDRTSVSVYSDSAVNYLTPEQIRGKRIREGRPMTDDLRDRIAAVLYERHYRLDGRPSDLVFNDLEPEIQRVYLADADAVIRELGLEDFQPDNTGGINIDSLRRPTVFSAIRAFEKCRSVTVSDGPIKLVNCAYCDYEGTPEELTTQHLNECP